MRPTMVKRVVSRRILVLLVILAVQALAISAVAQQATEVQAKDDNTFAPPTLTIRAGDRITFRNVGNLPHTATAKDGSFDTGNLNAGQSRTVRVTKSGTIDYVCTYHETLGMVGNVVVEGTAAPEPSPSPSPEPAAASPEEEDVDANLPLGIKVFPLLAGGMLALALVGMGGAWVRNVLRAAEDR
jgi:plastocyanin